MKLFKNKEYLPYLVFLLIATILTIIWFKDQKIVATGEESLVSVDYYRSLKLYLSPWIDINFGILTPFYLPRLPYYVFAMLLNKEFPSWVVQAVSFWVLLTSGMIGMSLLSKQLIENKYVAFGASVFYLLNLYTLSQIWNRALLTGMFAWAYLPIFLFCWICWINKGKVKWLFGLLLTSLLYSFTFGIVAYVFTFWIPALIWVGVELYRDRKKKNVTALLMRAGVGLLGWVLINIWWIYPVLALQIPTEISLTDRQSNLGSLISVSQYFPTDQIFLLRQSFLFGKESTWFDYYSQAWIFFLSILILRQVIVGIIQSRKEKSWPYILSLFFIGWFISKGANQPLGLEFFGFLFSTFPMSAVLRNPYEKFGLVFLLSYSIFFSIGVYTFISIYSQKIKLILLTIVFFFCGLLVLPMWNGELFQKSKITIPTYYKEVNDYISTDKNYSRILILPMLQGDSVKYTWGFLGIEGSEYLFDKPVVSRRIHFKYIDDTYMKLYDKMNLKQDITSELENMGIKYIILHHDYDSQYASSSADVAAVLQKNKQINFVNKFGELSLYEFTHPSSLFTTAGKKAPKVKYKKINSNKYEITIDKATSSFILVFKQTFHPRWKLTIDGELVNSHSVYYGYANSWKIENKGTFVAYLDFQIWPTLLGL